MDKNIYFLQFSRFLRHYEEIMGGLWGRNYGWRQEMLKALINSKNPPLGCGGRNGYMSKKCC